MKRFLVINLILILTACSFSFFLKSKLSDNNVLIKINDVSDLNNIHADLAFCHEYHQEYSIENLYEKYKGTEFDSYGNLVVMIVESTGVANLYNQCSEQKVIIKKIIEGDSAYNAGDTVFLVSNEMKAHSFYYEDNDSYLRRIERLPQMGFDEKKCPDYYKRAWQYSSPLNLMKKNHRYLVMYKETDADGINYCIMPYAFSYFDLTSDYSKPVEVEYGYMGDYCDYIENEMFGTSQEAVDQFLGYKYEILKKYGL